jgi:spore coat polysaccharide biosynthesis protein SpsF (cytidylyltransferase family)
MADAPIQLARPDVRLTVDTRDDLDRIRAVYSEAGMDLPTIGELIGAWDRARERSVA